ncbi:MAG: prolyl oligopeptidase family serine peptidase [Actinomycetota bacterium]|nr:prolyl oligopeptidase family serine peptidase [Actinomycetota bacterium]
MADSFPRQHARTQGFNLGLPRAFRVAPDGTRVAFTRSPAGDDRLAGLWVFDAAAGVERLAFDPAAAGGEREITDEERDRRERARERLAGVVAFATDRAVRVASFAVGERLFAVDLASPGPEAVTELKPAGPAFDPRPDPTGRRVAYVTHGDLRVADLAAATDTLLASADDPDVHWGLAEFIAAEEMERMRGYWWGPDGERLLAARVDDRPVLTWHIASPIDPARPPRPVRYPQAGTRNAIVTLHVLGLDGSRVDVEWDREAFEYLVNVSWTAEGPPLALIESRDQRTMRVITIDVVSGATQTAWEDHDDRWTHITPGTPAWLGGGRLLTAAHRDDTRRLMIDGEPATPVGLQVESVLDSGGDVLFRATDDPTEMHVWRLSSDGELARLTGEPGVHTGATGGDITVLTSETMASPLPVSVMTRNAETVHTFSSLAETPLITPRPTFFKSGPKELRTAIFTPGGAEPDGSLPVLMSPYGGPHFARVMRANRAHLESQWFADQGFVVVVADGRGTPNRGVAWDQAVHRDLASPALEDQVEALQATAERFGFLDLSKVAIRGWSFGGFLVCLAMLRRPDIFHAGIAGAPVTDQHYYDTFYTERYLGMPGEDADAYERSSVVRDAPNLRGELLIIHGLADDNCYVTHSIQLSKALLEAGRRHSLIPLSGITHRPVDPVAAENMLRIEVEFLQRALGITASAGG